MPPQTIPQAQAPDVVTLTVDLSELTFGDLESIMQWNDGVIDLKAALPLLNRIVVGGIKHLKVKRDLPKILDAVNKAMLADANPAGPVDGGPETVPLP